MPRSTTSTRRERARSARALRRGRAPHNSCASTAAPNSTRRTLSIIDPSAFAREQITLYVIASEERQEVLQPLIIALVDAIYLASLAQARDRPLEPPLLLALDECANIAPLRRLPGYLSQSRAAGIRFLTAWQALAQIEHRYGRRSGEILQASTAQIYAGSHTDKTTLEHLERQLAPLDADTPLVKRTIDARRLNGRFLALQSEREPRLLTPRRSFADRRLRRLAREAKR